MTDSRLPGRSRPVPASSGSFGGISSGASARGGGRRTGTAGSPTAEVMRSARRRWATGVGVLTTLALPGNAMQGTTVSSIAVLSLAPPLVSVSLEEGSRMVIAMQDSGIFAISILDRAHEFQSDRFSGYGPRPDAAFTGIPHQIVETGCPVLLGALAWFDCQVEQVIPTGDHVLIIGRALAVGIGEDSDDPLLSYEGAYRRIEGA